MKEQPIRIGVIGLGNRGRHFAVEWNRLPACRVTACCERDGAVLESARSAIGNHAIAYYDDMDRMLAEADLDAVVVATEERHHRECGVAVLRAGKHLFLEKPMAQTVEDCDALIRAWEPTNVVFMVGLELRYCSLCQAMKEILDRGDIGEVKIAYAVDNVSVGGDYYFHGPRRRRDRTVSLLLEKGVHTIDLMNWFVGSTPVRVYSETGLDVFGGDAPNDLTCPECPQRDTCPYSVGGPGVELDYGGVRLREAGCVYAREIDVDDNAVTLIRYAGGAKLMYCECHFAPDYNRHFTLIGTKGRMTGFYNNEQDFRIDLAYRHTSKSEVIFPPRREGSHGGGDAAIAEQFLSLVAGGRRACPGVLGARNAAAVAIAADQSSRTGRPETIPPYEEKSGVEYPP